MNLNDPVSGRQFAKMVGQSEGAVRKAVERQSILKGKTADGKFIPLVASLEWGKPILEEFLKSDPVPKQKTPPIVKPKREPRALKEKQEPTNAAEFLEEIMSEPLPKVSKKEVEAEGDTPLDNNSPKAEAERKTAIYKAKMAELAYHEKKGDMIQRAKIATVLFGYGQEIRVSLEGLTDRVLDRMRAVETRHEQQRILNEGIHETLTALSEIVKRNI